MMEPLQHSLYPLWLSYWYSLKLQLNCSKLMHLQINCIFLAITLKVLWQLKTMNNQIASDKDRVKYATVYM